MEDYIKILEKTSLFRDIAAEDISQLLKCIEARVAVYEKNEIILWEGSIVSEIGIVLSGCGHSFKTDASGKETMITYTEKGNFIGVLLAAGRNRKSPITVRAAEDMSVIFVPFDKIITHCNRDCTCHDALLRNCFDSITEKSLILLDRIDCLIRPTLREKILTYLTQISRSSEYQTFMIPFDRNAMAAYLSTDRSALSRELSRMKRDGLIDYYKNSFKIFR